MIHVLVIFAMHRLSDVAPKRFWNPVVILLLQSFIFPFLSIVNWPSYFNEMSG